MTRFLHLTDLHVSVRRKAAGVDRSDTLARLDQVIARMHGMRPRPDFIVVSGDLTDHGDDDSYARLAERMAGLSIPVVWALGNHDNRAGFRRAFPGHPGASTGALDHDVVHAGLHVIALDSSEPGKVGGHLEPSQLTRLNTMLTRHPELPKIISVHHPPQVSPGGAVWASLSEDASTGLAQAIAGHDVRAILSGHVHVTRAMQWHGVSLLVSQGLHSRVDASQPGEGLVFYDEASFAICDMLPSGLHCVQVPLSDAKPMRTVTRALRRDRR